MAMLCRKLFLINQRAFTGDGFKILVEAGKIIKPTFVTQAFEALIIFNKQFTGMAYSQFYQKLGIGFPGA